MRQASLSVLLGYCLLHCLLDLYEWDDQEREREGYCELRERDVREIERIREERDVKDREREDESSHECRVKDVVVSLHLQQAPVERAHVERVEELSHREGEERHRHSIHACHEVE